MTVFDWLETLTLSAVGNDDRDVAKQTCCCDWVCTAVMSNDIMKDLRG